MRRERLDLEKAHPLPFPLAIWLEPTNVCNFKCSFCPESFPDYGKQAGYYQHMKFTLWQKLARDIAELGRPKVIRFFHEGEPLLNRQLSCMIEEANQLTDRTEVFTNGSLLIDRAPGLVSARLSYLKISVYGVTGEDYWDFAQAHCTPGTVIEGVKQLRSLRRDDGLPFIHVKLMLPNSTPGIKGRQERFREQYQGLADQIDVMDDAHNWGSSLVQIGQAPSVRTVCPMPFYTMAIKANGLVTVCCADWKNELAVGDAAVRSLKEIWEGLPLKKIQALHWQGRRKELTPCRDCTAFADYPDNLDRHLSTNG